jgi:hypothetical protein
MVELASSQCSLVPRPRVISFDAVGQEFGERRIGHVGVMGAMAVEGQRDVGRDA